jgi:hypothetical protein
MSMRENREGFIFYDFSGDLFPAKTNSCVNLTVRTRFLNQSIKRFIVQLSERLPALLYTPNKEGAEKEKERRTEGEQEGKEGRRRRELQLLVPLVLSSCSSHMRLLPVPTSSPSPAPLASCRKLDLGL